MRKAGGGEEEEESEWSSGTVGLLKVTGGSQTSSFIKLEQRGEGVTSSGAQQGVERKRWAGTGVSGQESPGLRRVRTNLVECFLGDPAQVHVVVAGRSHLYLGSRTPPL